MRRQTIKESSCIEFKITLSRYERVQNKKLVGILGSTFTLIGDLCEREYFSYLSGIKSGFSLFCLANAFTVLDASFHILFVSKGGNPC